MRRAPRSRRPQAECSHAMAQPKIIRNPPTQQNGAEVILVEW